MRYTLLAFLCAVTVVGYVQRLALSAPTEIVERELSLGPEAMGVVLAVWYWGYAFAQLPAGWVADRLGSKSALILFAATWSILTALTGLATGFAELVVLWGLMGCAQAGIFPCCTKAIGATFPNTEQAFASGVLAAGMSISAAFAQWLTPRLLETMTWQQILVVYAVPGVVWAVAFAVIVPRIADHRPRVADGAVRWSLLVTNRNMQLLCGQQFLRAAAVAFLYTWFPRYLKKTQGLTEREAGELAFWLLIAGMVGGLVGGALSGWLLKRTGSVRVARQGMACAAAIVSAAAAFGAYIVTDVSVIGILLSVGAFSAMAGGVSGYAVAIAYGGKRVAIVFATMNMMGNIGAGLFPFAVGWLVAVTANWSLAMLVFAGLFAASAVCWAFLNPQGTLFGDAE
jgi:nitrate/nitrite transporter NarK